MSPWQINGKYGITLTPFSDMVHCGLNLGKSLRFNEDDKETQPISPELLKFNPQ